MIKEAKLLEAFENRLHLHRKFSYPETLRIFDGLYEEALALKTFPHPGSLRGLEHTFRLAKFLNAKTIYG